MASTSTSLINHNFGGIRRKDSMFSDEKITCFDCQNVELYFTELNSGVGIRTSKGNQVLINNLIPDNEDVIGMFETTQNGVVYFIVYTETNNLTTNVGKLYKLDTEQHILVQLNTIALSATGKCQASEFKQTNVHVLVFSNGVDLKFIYTNIETPANPLVIAGDTDSQIAQAYRLYVNLTDNENNTVYGLGLVNVFGRLWVFNGRTLWYSKEGAIGDFHNDISEDTSLTTRAGIIYYSKDITAIHEYLGALAVFHNNSSTLLTEDPTTLFKRTDESPGGCASYNSLVFHGVDLFFYDDTKKSVFSFQQVINGDKTLGENIAYDIQDELMQINKNDLWKIRSLSVVTSDRNEVWFLVPISVDVNYSIVLIYDYIRGEWIKRKCQHINAISIINGVLYSAGEQIYKEYTSSDFNGEYIENYYQCTVMNLGTDNTLKITKFPPRITIDASFKNHFFARYVRNYNVFKKPKEKELFSKSFGNILRYDNEMVYDAENVYKPNAISGIIKMPSATFKALEITFYTNDKDQEFTIKAIEFSKIKVKQI